MGSCRAIQITFLIPVVLVFSFSLCGAAVQDDSRLLKRIETVRKERDAVQDEIDRHLKKVQSLRREISQLKKQQETSSSLLASYRLDRLLKESSGISERLIALKKRLQKKKLQFRKIQEKKIRKNHCKTYLLLPK